MIKSPEIIICSDNVVNIESDVLCILYSPNTPRLLHALCDTGVIDAGDIEDSEIFEGVTKHIVPNHSNAQFSNILLIGTSEFYPEYSGIESFGIRCIDAVLRRFPNAKTISMIVHGPGYGLDINEAFVHLAIGLRAGVREYVTGNSRLEKIVVSERVRTRAARLKDIVEEFRGETASGAGSSHNAAVVDSGLRPKSVFVAMPFAEDMEDLYEFGIYSPSKDLDFICERADRVRFTGDIVQWIQDRIANADFVIAEVTSPNANVYLEIGLAWGCNTPTILITRDPSELKFDVASHKCIVYTSIRDLNR